MTFIERVRSRVRSDYRKYYALRESVKIGILKASYGVVHIGAHHGQELELYGNLGLKSILIEGDPTAFQILENNATNFKNVEVYCYLLGREDRSKVPFFIANNAGMSSSLYQFGKDMNHKGLEMIETKYLDLHRFDSLFKNKELVGFSHLVIDTQGSELDVLSGMGDIIKNFSTFEIELSNREEYLGGSSYTKVMDFMASIDASPLWELEAGDHDDVIFIRNLLFRNS